jgi:hypothetical protein
MKADGVVAGWNDRAAGVFGWSRDEAMSRAMADLRTEGAAWSTAAREAADAVGGVTVKAYTFGQELHDPENGFAAAYGISATGAVPVRPDGLLPGAPKRLKLNQRRH